MKEKGKSPDWAAIKADYLRGADSLRDIASWNGISDAAIRKRAKVEKWPPRAEQVRRAANREPAVRTQPPPPADEAAAPPDASAIADEGRGLVHRMLDELSAVTTRQGELEEMIWIETAGDKTGQRRDGMLRSISLGGRASTLKELSSALKTLNEASKPKGKKVEAQERAQAVAGRFGRLGPPLKVVK